MPKSWMELPESATMTPDQIRAYEAIYNDDLSGQTEQRNRMRLLVPGGQLKFEEGYSEKFSDRLDDYLITSITGHFGVLPTELGYSSKAGLGGSGHQQGEKEAAEAIGIIPTAKWLSQQLSALSYRWLGMPRELEFRLAPSDQTDNEEKAKRDDLRIRNGGNSLNEDRASRGMPLLDTPEADMPIFVAGQSVYLFGPDGMVAAGTNLDENGNEIEEPVETPTETPATPAQQEVAKFVRWINRVTPDRSFNFEHLEKSYAEVLNKFIDAKDIDGARWYAERYLGL
jgi:hypothetical protein